MPTRRAFLQTAGATCGGLLACALSPPTPLSAWGLGQEPLAATSLDAFATATAMLGALRRREVSAVELVDLHLRRIELYNPILQAIVQTSADTARQAAATADTLRTQGVDSPLLGLPVTIKGCIYTQGLPTACGVLERVDLEGTLDARAVRSLRSAGVVILGETNTSPYAMDWQATNPFARTDNPWDLTRTAGGSTGGGAAAVAAGLSPLELGTDYGGSLRIPAAFCGVYGHKPSETAVPHSGIFPTPPTPNSAIEMAVIGPIARGAEDLELALDVIAGPEAGEDVAWRLQLPPARHSHLSQYRVAILPPLDWLPVDDEIMASLERLARELGGLGARVAWTQPEGFGDLRDLYRLRLVLGNVIDYSGRSDEDRRQDAESLRASGEVDMDAVAVGTEASAAQFILWHDERERYRAAYRAFFQDWDVLLAPVNVVNAFPHTDEPYGERRVVVNGQPVPYIRQLVYTALANLTGQPATAFPAGLTRAGLPIGLQAVGPYLEDRTPIRFAALLAQQFGGFRSPPGFTSNL